MANNTLGLLFEISGDPSKAQGALEHFRTSTSSQLSSVKEEFRLVQKDVASWGGDFQNQLLSVGDGLAGLRDIAGLTFDRLAEGMGMNIALALVYAKSFSAEMDQALRATTAAIAGESVIQALRSMGLGFYLLAVGDTSGSANAFKAAAIWGSIGAVAGGLSRALPGAGTGVSGPSSARAGSYQPGSAGAGIAGTTEALALGSAAAPVGGNVTVLVMGEPQAAQWLTQVINTGVEQQDLRLVASHTKRSAPAGH
ncbi:MAG TPA: hypothetical protein VGW33_15360 [Terriglobia bacterium]|nr:hypothetical protein [Terriglobia bacterium]